MYHVIQQQFLSWEFTKEKWKKKRLYANVYTSIIHNSKKIETTQCLSKIKLNKLGLSTLQNTIQ